MTIRLPLFWSTWSQATYQDWPTMTQHFLAWRMGSDYSFCLAKHGLVREISNAHTSHTPVSLAFFSLSLSLPLLRVSLPPPSLSLSLSLPPPLLLFLSLSITSYVGPKTWDVRCYIAI